MHVLTKIFIVLVCLLAILIVPLVVVYAQNEENYKSKYEDALADVQASNAVATSTQLQSRAEITRIDNRLKDAQSAVDDLAKQKADAEVELRRVQSELAEAEMLKAEIRAHIATLTQVSEANSTMTQGLVDDLRELRAQVTTIQRENVELDESLRDVMSQLDSTMAANRALREELQRANEEKGQMLATLDRYQEVHGPISSGVAMNLQGGGIIPDVSLVAAVTGVSETNDRTIVEIEAGSRDGVKEDWLMTVGRGGTLIGRIRIINVDINKSLGELMYDDRLGTSVQIGDKAYASPNG